MVKIFLFIKEKIPAVWSLIEWLNGIVFSLLFAGRFRQSSADSMGSYSLEGFKFRPASAHDLPALSHMILSQSREELKYFEAHEFDLKSLKVMFRNPSFLMMVVYSGSNIAGYFFLRCLINRRCFVGRMVDRNYRGKGIGKVMNEIMYNTAWNAGFRCFATVSKKNHLVMGAHRANRRVVFLEDLPDDHILIEFVKDQNETGVREGS